MTYALYVPKCQKYCRIKIKGVQKWLFLHAIVCKSGATYLASDKKVKDIPTHVNVEEDKLFKVVGNGLQCP